jgi:diaminopimelate decarboxylase
MALDSGKADMEKKAYVKPAFFKQTVGVMNKFGNTCYKGFTSSIDGAGIDGLIGEFGSPLFVFSERTLRKKYRELYGTFSTRYPNVSFGWSYKTNYNGAICSLFHQEGSLAEVVSDFEYERARSLGVRGCDIIFNGPHKGSCMERAFAENARVNIDNFSEIFQAEQIAARLGKKLKTGIRINLDAGIYPQWNKFGFNLESGQAYEAVSRIARSNTLVLNGLHCHIGTFILDVNAYKTEVEKMVAFMHEIEDQFGITFEYLDIGGGFPSLSRLKGIYLPPDVVVPPVDEYAEAICGTLLRRLKPNAYPKLILETGRALVDEAGYLITTVIAQKQLPEGIKSYFVDTGINQLYTSTWYTYSIQPDRQLTGVPEICRLFGSLCMNIDVIADSVYLPPLPIGSHLVMHPVGAYNTSQWMQFITYRPAIVMVTEAGGVVRIRRRETLEDVVRCEVIPERFVFKGKEMTGYNTTIPQ